MVSNFHLELNSIGRSMQKKWPLFRRENIGRLPASQNDFDSLPILLQEETLKAMPLNCQAEKVFLNLRSISIEVLKIFTNLNQSYLMRVT